MVYISIFFRKWLDDEYAKMTGYNEVAELNNIIVIYPQATSNFLDSNPNGCWDWWGYLDSLFGTSEYSKIQIIGHTLFK